MPLSYLSVLYPVESSIASLKICVCPSLVLVGAHSISGVCDISHIVINEAGRAAPLPECPLRPFVVFDDGMVHMQLWQFYHQIQLLRLQPALQ